MISRRSAIILPAALALPSILRAQPALAPVTPTPFARTTPRLMIACRQKSIPDYDASANPTAIDATNNTLNSRMVCFAPTGSALTDIVLAYPGFGNNLPEADVPVSYTVTAAVEYPIGTFTPVYLADGSRTMTVAPGRTLQKFQPCPVNIPAGAQFYVKSFVSWTGTLWLSRRCACCATGEWTKRAVGASDATLTTTNLAPSNSDSGFGPVVYGRLRNPSSVLGIIGDSLCQSAVDPPNIITGAQAFDAAMLGVIPVVQLGRSSDTTAFHATRPDGRSMVLRDSITHLVWAMGRNDTGTNNAAVQQAAMQGAIDPYLSRGIRVFGITVTPVSSSTDSWATLDNQTGGGTPPRETNRLAWNAALRSNWQAMGLSGIFDWAHAVDPTDSGKWSVDGSGGLNAAGFATLSGGSVASVAYANYTGAGFNSGGSNYGNAQTGPCVVIPYPGDPGTGAVVTWTSNSSGLVLTYTVVNGGSGYLYPPMIAPRGSWTNDGTHPTHRGYAEIIVRTGFGPAAFVL